MTFFTNEWKGLVGALIMAFIPGAATAQATPAPPDQEELETFTAAYVEIAEVRAELSPELAAAETPEEAAEIQDEANNRMMAVLDDHDLDVDRYTEITAVLNQDEALRAQFEEMYAQMSSGGG